MLCLPPKLDSSGAWFQAAPDFIDIALPIIGFISFPVQELVHDVTQLILVMLNSNQYGIRNRVRSDRGTNGISALKMPY